MPDPLTELERRVLDYLVDYLRSNTYQPSVREIGQQFSIRSTKTVSELLQSLADKGWIERDPSRSRGVRLLGLGMRTDTVSVPFYDEPDAAVPSTTFELDRRVAGPGGTFLIVMRGTHLAEEGIRAGDLLLIEPVEATVVQSGDVALCRFGGETAVRRCERRGADLVLDATRPGEVPLHLTPRQAAGVVRGRVAGVVRRLRPSAEHAPAARVPSS